MDAREQTLLILDWHDRRLALDGRREAAVLGSHTASDLPVSRPFTSRRHARIERRRHSFVLVDESTNGTWVQTEDERVAFVHRSEMRLWGEGWISLGEPPARNAVVRFRHG